MTITELEAAIRAVCVGEFSSFLLSYNDHSANYQTAAEAIAENHSGLYDDDYFASPEEKQRCIDTNTIWDVQWYPDTPVGFNRVIASTLGAALAKVEQPND